MAAKRKASAMLHKVGHPILFAYNKKIMIGFILLTAMMKR